MQPCLARKVIAKVKCGLSHHHKTPARKSLRKSDGSLTSTNKECADTLSGHFATIFSRTHITFDPTVLCFLPNSPVHNKLAAPPLPVGTLANPPAPTKPQIPWPQWFNDRRPKDPVSILAR